MTKEHKIRDARREIDWCIKEAEIAKSKGDTEWLECLKNRFDAACGILNLHGCAYGGTFDNP